MHHVSRAAVSSPDVSLALVKALAVDSHGTIYVGDWLLDGVSVLDPHGQLVRVIGRAGSGPGEFRTVEDVEILRDGKLLVYDPNQSRITVFLPGGDSVAKIISVASTPQSPNLMTVRVAGDADPIVVGVYASMGYSDRETPDQPRTQFVRTLSMAGAVLDSILTFPYKQNLVCRSRGGVAVTTHPFGRRGFIRVGGDRIYYGWTDTVGVRTYSVRGEFTGGFKAAYERAAVTSDDVDRALTELEEPYFQRLLQASVPETWPAFEDFVVDDRGRAWFGIIEEGGVTTRWDGFTPEGEYVGSLEFPPDFDLKVVRGDRAYGVQINELDVPRIEVYRIDWLDSAEVTAP